MCAWLLAILVDNKSSTALPWISDLSGLPYSRRAAYGRIITTSFSYRDASIKRLSALRQSQVYALSLMGSNRTTAIVYFTRENGLPIERFEVRHRPNQQTNASVSNEITSVQFLAPDPITGEIASHIYKHSFSARVSLGSIHDSRAIGSIILVFPDSKRSFVSGAFKARLVGLNLP